LWIPPGAAAAQPTSPSQAPASTRPARLTSHTNSY